MVVRFISDLCAFDAAGKVVALRPDGCADAFAPAGAVRRVGTIDFSRPLPVGGGGS